MRRLALAIGGVALAAVAMWLLVGWVIEPTFVYVPPADAVLNPRGHDDAGTVDVWGRRLSEREAGALRRTEEGRRLLDPANGAVVVDRPLLDLGREAFYRETFGDEVFLTDVLGVVDGPVTLWSFAKALVDLGGRGTTNLKVTPARTTVVGGRTFDKRLKLDTGLDVARGAYLPLGMVVKISRGRVRVGMTCAACHATVDETTGLVIEGAPNRDVRAGLLLALARNSAAYFLHADIRSLEAFVKTGAPRVPTSDGGRAPLPDPAALEDAVDATLLRWPAGTFDSTVDTRADPTRIPSAFARGARPYGWSGFAAVGPFRGLSVLTNNVHGLNTDALASAGSVRDLVGIDPEVYVATVLRRAARPRLRYDPASGQRPSAFLASLDPTPQAPGLDELIALPTYPHASAVTPDGLWASRRGYPVWRHVNAMAAWQATLVPPPAPLGGDPEVVARGRAVFIRAGCAGCHAGPYLTNNRVVPAPVIGTEPVRARAFAAMAKTFVAPPLAYAFDTPVPVPPGARVLRVPTDGVAADQLALAMAHDTPGGYKVPALVGLWWTAPYLHDGGVAVGADAARDIGVPATLLRGIAANPANSLRALVDRELRAKVVAANRASPELTAINVRGIGHELWVDDAAGFPRADQHALIYYLLSVNPAP